MKIICSVVAFCAATAIVAPAQTFTTLVNFDHNSNGSAPYASLIQGTDGNLYGTTSVGGANGNGTVFKMTPAGTLTTIYSFCALPGCADGSEPNAGLVQASDGNFYGTTIRGGTTSSAHCAGGCGTVFKIAPGGTLTTLYSFGYSDGYLPHAGLVQATDGNLYGTTEGGGANSNCGSSGCGTVFKITLGGTLTTLHSFDGTDGSTPYAGLVQAIDGNFYGTTFFGGAKGDGTVFKITPEGTLTALYSFCTQAGCTDGSSPQAGLVQTTDGNFYGTTQSGGANIAYGTVFKITPEGAFTTLYSFCAQAGCTDGYGSHAALVQATDGNFYGTTLVGGTACSGSGGCGTLFKITPGGSLTTLHSFDGTDGRYPYDALLQANDGSFYGTTNGGGTSSNCSSGCGTVFNLYLGLGVPLSVTTVGSGTITSSDGSINCGSVCSSIYKSGSVVTLTATPAQGWALTKWAGCDTTNGDACTVTITTARSVTATFTMTYPLSVSTTGTGTVTSADGDINCGATCSHTYLSFSGVTLTATPAPNWALTSWTGCDAVHGSTCTVSMYHARFVSATFAMTYLVSVATSGSGTVISGDGHINCGSACSYSYPNGTRLGLTAIPAVGSTLGNWSSSCSSTQGNVCTVVVDATSSVSATFSTFSPAIKFSSLTFSPSKVRHGNVAVGTLTLAAAAPTGGITIGLKSSQPGIVSVPSIIYVSGGLSSFKFGARVIGARRTTVTITATDGNTSTAGTLQVIP